MQVQAVLVAGDRGASRAIGGRSKTFAEVAGKPMVVHVIESLVFTPEVREIYVVGHAERLERALVGYGCLQLAATHGCPIHVVPQRNSLFENVWHSFLRTLPPGRPSEDHPILVVPTDIPVAIPEEISDFVAKALETGADYGLGLSPASSLERFAPTDGGEGIRMAYFNLREGRFRQNNLHLVRPLRMGNRHYIQEMYENRYQKEVGSALRLGWRVLRSEFRNLWVLYYFGLLHIAGVLDRRGHRRWADRVRRHTPLERIEAAMSALLRTRVVCVTTELGGAALDIDNAFDLAVADKMIGHWKAAQARLTRAA